MRLLLDTHVVLWQLEGSRRLSAAASEAISEASELLFSVVSLAEIGTKVAVGKLTVPDDLGEQVVAAGVRVLGLAGEQALAVAALPLHHRDPFDRLLVAQAQALDLTVVTADRRFAAYGVRVVDAS